MTVPAGASPLRLAFDTGEQDPEWAAYLDRAEVRQRYHCCGCGRFVPAATVKAGFSRYDPYEWEAHGTCKACGRVEVHWGAL